MSTERALRVAQSVKRELSDMIRRDLKDPRLSGLISFTEVECTADLRSLKVFVSVFGTNATALAAEGAAAAAAAAGNTSNMDEDDLGREPAPAPVVAKDAKGKKAVVDENLSPAEKATAGVLACLNEEAGYIRGELCRRLKLRFAPELQFLPDISLERGSKVSEILAKISRGEA
jgi:ribosome-binding factor A